MEWCKKNLITILLVVGSWIFTIGYVKAETEGRLGRLESDVAEVKSMMFELKVITTKLEVVTDRLERLVEE
jgi:hypothetical protein